MYGYHLFLDIRGCSKEMLGNEKKIYSFLKELPEQIKMTTIMGPHTMSWLEPGNPEWGISGFVIIAESHIAIHTYPDKGEAYVDVFSCKEFDLEFVKLYVTELFGAEQVSEIFHPRGRHLFMPKEDTAKLMELSRNVVKKQFKE